MKRQFLQAERFELMPRALAAMERQMRQTASIQTSRHGRENEERSSLHKQLIFVAFGVPYYAGSRFCECEDGCL